MPNYSCMRCGFSTTQKNDFRRHLDRKTMCEDKLNSYVAWEELKNHYPVFTNELSKKLAVYECEHCNARFKSRQARHVHSKTCSKNPQPIEGLTEKESRIVEAILAKINTQQPVQQNITVNVTNNNNNSNNYVNINAFGFENQDHIMQNKNLLNKCLVSKNMIPLLEQLHFDKSHPENKNIKIPNVKLPRMMVYDGMNWVYRDKNEVLSEMINTGKNILDEHYVYNEEDVRNTIKVCRLFDEIGTWINRLKDEDQKIICPLMSKLYNMILNHR